MYIDYYKMRHTDGSKPKNGIWKLLYTLERWHAHGYVIFLIIAGDQKKLPIYVFSLKI